ncbi:MAG: hypothetical protein V4683_04095 [Bacteroidota bacterium]
MKLQNFKRQFVYSQNITHIDKPRKVEYILSTFVILNSWNVGYFILLIEKFIENLKKI